MSHFRGPGHIAGGVGRGGFTLLPEPARLPRALPEIYQTLTMET